ncbi:MAG: glycosyltransferase family 4 protein [Planctomycetes bacterium]|nr:glycosyltransferase family 4 protein [Planctomycetota bacterium]
MKICHVITRLIVGGAQENTLLTCRGLAERGHDVTLIAGPETGPEGSLWEQAERFGGKLLRLASLRRAVHPVLDVRARVELTRIFDRLGPDVVHTHSSKAGILGRFAAARAGVPTIVHTIHGMSFNRTQGALTRMAYRALERRAARYTSHFVTVADAMIDQSVAAGIAPRERFVVIRSGLEVERFAPDARSRESSRKRWGVSGDEIVVGTVARLFQHKGYESILKAMPRMVAREPRLRFVWMGDGPHRKRYERLLERIGLFDRVTFLGLVAPEAVAEAINGFDMVLHASRWEGLPRAVVQGLLAAVPAVSFDIDGAGEVVVDNETGRLVRYGDVDGLADAVVALAGDSQQRRKLGLEGRARCVAAFDWRKMVNELDALYARLRTCATVR